MTLIDYILTGFDLAEKEAEEKGEAFPYDEYDLFDNESQASYARAWDAEVFAKKILKKELDDTNFGEMYKAFKAIARHIEVENVSYESLYVTEEEKRKIQNNSIYQPYRNGAKKRNLIYNENYEQSSEDDFD